MHNDVHNVEHKRGDSNSTFDVVLLKVCLFVVQTRKPLVEKKRRARINESLQELRSLLADTEV